MSGTRCYMQLTTCGPAAAWLTTNPAANTIHLCQHCLNWWFDNADNGDAEEPLAWGWTWPPTRATVRLTREQIVRALTDPRNHRQVSEVLHAESLRNPGWLREFLLREAVRNSRLAPMNRY